RQLHALRRPRGGGEDRGTGAGRGLGRRHARDGARVRGSGRRLHRGGGPDPLRSGLRRLAGDRARDMTGGLVDELRRRGHRWPAPVERHERLSSTSDRLKELARAGARAWRVALVAAQAAGGGRQGRAWASPPGGLYLSVLLRPALPQASLLPLAAGLAVAEAVDEFGVHAELKWPNDVLADGRKLAG